MKWKILELLENHSGEFISGENIASSLGITRAAVWKSVKSLQNEGYKIQAVKNRGYSLLIDESKLSRNRIAKHLSQNSKIMLTRQIIMQENSQDRARLTELS